MKYQIRQLGLGETLDQAIQLIRDHLGLFLSIVAITIPVNLFFGLAIYQFNQSGNVIGSMSVMACLFLIGVPIALFVTASLTAAISRSYLSKPTTVSQSLQQGMFRFFPMIGTYILYLLAMMGGLILLVIPAIIFGLMFSLAHIITVVEEVGPIDAMGRSRELMKGSKLNMLALGLILVILNSWLSAIANFAMQPHLQVILSSFISPVTTVIGDAALVVFYYSCRCKVENYDLLSLARILSAERTSSGDDPQLLESV